jgi:hypothetical protein
MTLVDERTDLDLTVLDDLDIATPCCDPTCEKEAAWWITWSCAHCLPYCQMHTEQVELSSSMRIVACTVTKAAIHIVKKEPVKCQ